MSVTKKPSVKHVTSIMSVMGNLPPVIPAVPTELPPGTAEVVNTLFRELQAIFPAWKQAWPDAATLASAKRSWIKAFMAEGITQLEQIRYGIQNCRRLGGDFAPSVGKFIKWCQPTPEMLGIPSHDVAFREALENSHPSRSASRIWSHPAVRHAALQCELHNLADLASANASEIFDRAYDITIRMLVQGQPLDDIAVGIGHDAQKSEMELAAEEGKRFIHATMRRQGVPADGKAARAQLLAKMKIKGGCRAEPGRA
jgi:hypothetical protein